MLLCMTYVYLVKDTAEWAAFSPMFHERVWAGSLSSNRFLIKDRNVMDATFM